MKNQIINIIFFLLTVCSASILCGRYSDNCSTMKTQDVDYIFIVGPSGDVESIEMDNNVPEDDKCGENHAQALIWHYEAKRVTPGENSFYTKLTKISFASWNDTTIRSYGCNITMEHGRHYQLFPNPEIDCRASHTIWQDFGRFIGESSTYTFTLSDDKVIFSRYVLSYVNRDGCASSVSDTTWIIVIVVIVFLVIFIALGILYYVYYKKSVKTLAGEKIKLYKQNQQKKSIFSFFKSNKNTTTVSKDKTTNKTKIEKKSSTKTSDKAKAVRVPKNLSSKVEVKV